MARRDKKRITQDSELARFYLDLIITYEKLGIGNKTIHNVKVTKGLIQMCKDRFVHHAIKAHKREIDYEQ